MTSYGHAARPGRGTPGRPRWGKAWRRWCRAGVAWHGVRRNLPMFQAGGPDAAGAGSYGVCSILPSALAADRQATKPSGSTHAVG